jgi:hypothetical protein
MLVTPGLTSSPTSPPKSVENKPSLVVVALLVVVNAVVLDVVDMELFVALPIKEDSRKVVVSVPMDMVITTKAGLQLPTGITMVTTVVTTVVVMDTVMMLMVVITKEDVVPLLLVVQAGPGAGGGRFGGRGRGRGGRGRGCVAPRAPTATHTRGGYPCRNGVAYMADG